MPKPQSIELQALEQAGVVLRFAAENSKEVPEKISATIVHAWEARDTNKWTPDIAIRFWAAYNALCALVKPATVDTLITTNQVLQRRRWFWGPFMQVTAARWTARRYINLLIGSLLLAIVFQFVVSAAANLTTDIDKISAENAQIAEKLTQDIASLAVAIGDKKFSDPSLNADQIKLISNAVNEFEKIWSGEDRIAIKLNQLVKITSLQLNIGWEAGDLRPPNTVEIAREYLIQYYRNVRFFADFSERASIRIKILNTTVLPLLLGFVGACAYVSRLISDQIKDSTFSSISPVRHHVRVVLDALAGVVVGFGWIGTGISASPLAVAFIAGYSVEPVFATVDSIAEKFRKGT